MKYFSSDHHINHFNVINYCNRPYGTLEVMNQDIVDKINARVTEKDELYLIGDVSLNPKWVEWLLPLLNCKRVHLIMGNHDSTFPHKLGNKSARTARMIERYYNAGFITIEHQSWVTLEKKYGDWRDWFFKPKSYQALMCHFPPAPKKDVNSSGDVRYLQFRPKDEGQIILHGHSHCYYLKNKNCIDVGFDHKLAVWSEEELIDLIEDKREYIPSRITEYYKSKKDSIKEDY